MLFKAIFHLKHFFFDFVENASPTQYVVHNRRQLNIHLLLSLSLTI